MNPQTSKIYDVIIDITTYKKISFLLFLLNGIEYQDETWGNISVTYEQHLTCKLVSAHLWFSKKMLISWRQFTFSSWWLIILIATGHTFKRIKNLWLIIIGCWVIRIGWKLKKGLYVDPAFRITLGKNWECSL